MQSPLPVIIVLILAFLVCPGSGLKPSMLALCFLAGKHTIQNQPQPSICSPVINVLGKDWSLI